MNTYSVEHDSIHYACEATIGRYRDELSDSLAAGIKSPTASHEELKKLAENACQKKARCLERKSSESVDARAKKLTKKLDERDAELDERLAAFKKEYEAEHAAGKGRREAKRKKSTHED